MEKIWKEQVEVTGYIHAYVVYDDYNPSYEPHVQREERALCINATAWYCKKSGTYRLDALAVLRGGFRQEEAWDASPIPLQHLSTVIPGTPKTELVRDAINRIDVYVEAARQAFARCDLDMAHVNDHELLAQHKRDSIPF